MEQIEQNLLKKIAQLDRYYLNEIRSLQNKNSKIMDRASIYGRSDLYNMWLPRSIEKICERYKLKDSKILLGSNKYLKNFVNEEHIFNIVENLYGAWIENTDNTIISSYSKQYIYYVLFKNNLLNLSDFQQVDNSALDMEFKKEILYYNQRLELDDLQLDELVNEYEINNAKYFGSNAHLHLLNSGTTANWVAIEYAIRNIVSPKIFIEKSFYYENKNHIEYHHPEILSDIDNANIYLLNVSNTNYFELNTKYLPMFDQFKEKVETRKEKVIVVVDISSDPNFRITIENPFVEIIYTLSLTKLCGDISLYFAGAIITFRDSQKEIGNLTKKLGVEMDPIARRFFAYPTIENSAKRYCEIIVRTKYITNLLKAINNNDWWVEPLLVNAVLHPPMQFLDLIYKHANEENVNIFLRFFYHNLQKKLNKIIFRKYPNEILLGDSFGMSYMRFNVQGRDILVDGKSINLRYPRISFGFGVEKKIQRKILMEIIEFLNANAINIFHESFSKDFSIAKKSVLN